MPGDKSTVCDEVSMTDEHEQIEHARARRARRHAGFNKKIALLIAVLALFLAFSETLGKSAQTAAIDANIEASNLWNFFQAKTIRSTALRTAAEELTLEAAAASDAAAKAAMQKQIDDWQKTAARYRFGARNQGRPQGARRSAPRSQEAQARSRAWRATTITSSRRRRSRSASCWRRRRSSPAWWRWPGSPAALGVDRACFMALGLFAPHAVPLLAIL